MQSLFGKQPTPQEQAKEWIRSIKKKERELDRNIREIEREQLKVKRSIKEAAKRNETDSVRVLAREIVASNKTTARLHKSKAQLHSVVNQLNTMLASARVVGHLQKSSQLMTMMNRLMSVTAVAETMRELSREMTKAGVIEEMMDEGFEDLDAAEGMEDEVEAEVEKVITEVTVGRMAGATATPAAPVPAPVEEAAASASTENTEAMRERLKALKS